MDIIYMRSFKGTERLDGKTVIVTGSNTGIGLEAAKEFYKRGARVIMACRNLEKAKKASDNIKTLFEDLENVGELVIRELNLASFRSIRKCADEILNTEPAIHILVNNAGVHMYSTVLTEDGYEMNFQTNHLGPFLFTLLLVPRLIKSAPARVIMVSSLLYAFCDGKLHFDDVNLDRNFFSNLFVFPSYGRSKLANILFAKELARKLEGTGVTTYSLHPGIADTGAFSHWYEESPLPVRIILKAASYFYKSTTQCAQTIVYCALDEQCGKESGLYYRNCKKAIPLFIWNCEKKCKELWEESLKIVNLTEFDLFTPL